MSVELIVVALDDSPGSCAAAAWATDLARDLDATVLAVHAYQPLDHVDEIEPGHDLGEVRDEVSRRLRSDWCLPLREAEVTFETRVAEGHPAEVIVDIAREVGADLIVMGARRLGLVRALALGGTSHAVIREATCPVTVIHPPQE